MNNSAQALRGRLGAITRWSPENLEERERLREQIRAARAEEHIRRIVAEAPPLSQAQRDRLSLLLRDAMPDVTSGVPQP